LETDVNEDTGEEEEATLEAKKKVIPTAPNVQYSDAKESIMDVGQAVVRGRGRPRKERVTGEGEKVEPVPPGPSNGGVTDKGTKMCVDPRGSGAILRAGENGGPSLPGGEEEMTVGIRQWRRLDASKMSEDRRIEFDTTPKHPYAQSTYHCVCHVQQSVVQYP
jgi:hypothetical protein